MSYDCTRCLGVENIGPRQLTESDRFEIALQVTDHLLSKGLLPRDGIFWDLFHNSGDLQRNNDEIYTSPDGGSLVFWVARKLNKAVKDVSEDVLRGQELDRKTLFGENGEHSKLDIPTPLSKKPTYDTSRWGGLWVHPPQPEHVLRANRVPVDIPAVLNVGGALYSYRDCIPLSAKNGEFIGGIAVYRTNSHPPIILPLRVCMHDYGNDIIRHRLRLGWNYKKFPFANEDRLLKQPTDTVLLCLDLQAALQVAILHNENKLLDGIVPTCHFGGAAALERVNWEALYMRDVFVVPGSTRESYADAYAYATKLQAQGARSVNICQHSLLCHPKSEYGEDVSKDSDPLVQNIVLHALDLAVVFPGGLIEKVLRKTRSPEEFKVWGSSVGLFEEEEPEKKSRRSRPLRISEGIESYDTTICLDKIFVPELPSGWIGPSDGGKGLSALTTAVGLATQTDVFHFKVAEKKRCLYIDAETSEAEAREKLNRIACGLGLKAGMDIDEFAHWSLLSDPPNSPVDLARENFRAEIESEICATKADIVFFDNLNSLANGVNSNSALWNLIFEWFISIGRKYNVATVCLHHTNKEGKLSGPVTIEGKLRTVIMLDDLEILAKEAKKSGEPTPYSPYLDRPGCLMRLWCKKCKPYPQLKHNLGGYYLELMEANRAQGPNWVCVEHPRNYAPPLGGDITGFNESGAPEQLKQTETDEEPAFESVEEVETVLSLIPEAHLPALEAMKPAERDEVLKVLELAQDRHGGFTVNDVKDLLECADTKAQNRVKVLFDFDFLDRLGQASSTRYKIRSR